MLSLPSGDIPLLTSDDQRSISTSDNSTVSDLPGAGRSVDKVLSHAAKRLNRLILRVTEVLGYGPNALVRRTIRHAALQMTPTFTPCPRCRHEDTIKDLLPGLEREDGFHGFIAFLFATPALACVECRSSFVNFLTSTNDARKCCTRLTGYLESRNLSCRMAAIAYIRALATFDDNFRRMFLATGACHILEDTASRRLLCYAEDTSYALQLSSRSALVCLEESNMLRFLKNFDAANNSLFHRGVAQDTAENRIIVADISSHLREMIVSLIADVTSLDGHILCIRRLQTFLPLWTCAWLFSTIRGYLTQQTVISILKRLAICRDASTRQLLLQLVSQLFTTSSYWLLDARGRESYAWLWRDIFGAIFMFRNDYPELFHRIDGSLWTATSEAFHWYAERYAIADSRWASMQDACPELLPSSLLENGASSILGRVNWHILRVSCQFQEERVMFNNFWDIPRSIPRRRREALCKALYDGLISVGGDNECSMLAVKATISPWDTETREVMQATATCSAHRVNAFLPLSSAGVPPDEERPEWLECTGLAVGIDEQNTCSRSGVSELEAFDDHWCLPSFSGRTYRKDGGYARLVAGSAGWRSLRWMVVSDMPTDGSLWPIAVACGHETRHLGCFRQDPMGGKLSLLDGDLHAVGGRDSFEKNRGRYRHRQRTSRPREP